jgi:hypothetical protein
MLFSLNSMGFNYPLDNYNTFIVIEKQAVPFNRPHTERERMPCFWFMRSLGLAVWLQQTGFMSCTVGADTGLHRLLCVAMPVRPSLSLTPQPSFSKGHFKMIWKEEGNKIFFLTDYIIMFGIIYHNFCLFFQIPNWSVNILVWGFSDPDHFVK